MDSRPPSARPTTRQHQQQRPATASVRRPKTAGRNSERPPSGVGRVPSSAAAVPATSHGRPLSRIGLSNDMIAASAVSASATRPGTARVAAIPPASATGTRAVSRRALRTSAATGMRPGTTMMASRAGVPPDAAAVAQRPITQQGLRGATARTPGTRASTRAGGGRLVADASYYMGLLNNQLNSLDEECGALAAELEKAQRVSENLLAYEQRAEEQAQELKQLQGDLADYNMIIDRQNTNTNLRTLGIEADEVITANRDLSAAVEDLFRERKVREEGVQELEERIARVRAENAARAGDMERELKAEFEQVSAEAEALAVELAARQSELDELCKRKEEMDLALANSPLKQQAMMLEEQLQELRDRRTAILSELHTEETPEAQREHFVQSIQRDNEEIAHMQAQLQEMQERHAQAQEELQELRNDMELGLDNDKSGKFRELKGREAQMDTFLEDFEQARAQRDAQIATLGARVVHQLQLISLNCRHAELASGTMMSGLDESVLALGNNSAASATELQDLHVRLQEELITLDQNDQLLRTELAAMRAKQADIHAAMGQMRDASEFKAELAGKIRDLQARRGALQEELTRVEAERNRLREQTASEHQRFSENAQLTRLRELKTRVDTLEAERRAVDDQLNAQRAQYDYAPAKQRALQLRAEYNELLVQQSAAAAASMGTSSIGGTSRSRSAAASAVR